MCELKLMSVSVRFSTGSSHITLWYGLWKNLETGEIQMCRIIMMLVLAVISNRSMAEWTKLIANGNDAIFYVDLSAKRESGSIVQMWDLTDFNADQKNANGSFLSRIIEGEYNCKENQERVVFVTRYRGHMGNGTAVNSSAYPNAKWESVSGGTIGEALWKAACKK
jgi:hypothetical protein